MKASPHSTDNRITESDLSKELEILRKDKLLCYICGPPPMIHSMEEMLIKLGLNRTQILYEQWW